MPFSAKQLIGRPFIDVQKSLLKLGFNVEKITLNGIIKNQKGFFKKDGQVVGITFNDNPNIEKGARLDFDTEIKIEYLTYL